MIDGKSLQEIMLHAQGESNETAANKPRFRKLRIRSVQLAVGARAEVRSALGNSAFGLVGNDLVFDFLVGGLGNDLLLQQIVFCLVGSAIDDLLR